MYELFKSNFNINYLEIFLKIKYAILFLLSLAFWFSREGGYDNLEFGRKVRKV
jgi:hypothetical protein